MPADSPTRPSEPHLVLVGLPGAGKSEVGRRVAALLGRPFLDFDEEIERREGAAVAAIFARQGEAYFRACELTLTQEVAVSGGMVVAPGGGWVTAPGAMALLRGHSRIIYLRVTPETALHRLGNDRVVRPLIAGDDPLATLRRILREREERYLAADHVLDVDHLDLQEVIETVTRLAPRSEGG